jgi:tRNA nucleotidyltransferase (CCA-adding enzyme)
MTATNDYIQRCDAFMAGLGFESYRVGGSVRDQILGRRVKDADYMVRGASLTDIGRAILKADGKPSALKLRDGRQAGWRANVKGLGLIEIVLPRKERPRTPCDGKGNVFVGGHAYASPGESYAPCPGCRACGKVSAHRDFEIVLDPALPIGEDAERRDFTFNALYFLVPDGPVADPTSRGLYDLEHMLVQTTHPNSFRDDPLRTLRALRFVSVLGYDLTAECETQMREHADAVDGLTITEHASGTVYEEMSKLLMGQDVAKALRIARDTGVLGTLFPELAPMLGFDQGSKYHDMTTCEHTFTALETAAKVDAPLRVRWALLFHDSGKPAAAWIGEDGRKHYYGHKTKDRFGVEYETPDHEIVGERLWMRASQRMSGVPKDIRRDVATLIRNHMVTVVGKVKGSKVRRARVKFGDELLRDLYLHRMCDISGKGNVAMNHMRQIGRLEELRQEAEAAGVPCSVKDLAIGGKDMQASGVTGPDIGRVLREVLDEVVVDPQARFLTRDWQLERAAKLAGQA